MVYGLHAVGKVAVGVAGVVALSASANVVAIATEVVRRGLSQIVQLALGAEKAEIKMTKDAAKDSWKLKDFTPYSSTATWSDLGLAGLKNVVLGTAALFVANRFCPSLVTNANWLLHKVVGIQFTPDHIPLTKLAGL